MQAFLLNASSKNDGATHEKNACSIGCISHDSCFAQERITLTYAMRIGISAVGAVFSRV